MSRRGARTPALRALALAVLALAACATPPRSGPDVRSSADLIEAGDRELDERSYGRALENYRLGALAADRAGDEARFVEAASQAASVLCLQGLPDEARGWYVRAEERADPGAALGWSRLLMARGLLDWRGDRDAEALTTFTELYNYCILQELTVRAVQAAQLATLVAAKDDQLVWAERAIAAARTTGDPALEAPLWANLGWLLVERGLYGDAAPAFERSLEFTVRSEATRLGRARAEWAYAHVLRNAGRLEEAQLRLDELLAVTTGLYMSQRNRASAEYLGRTLTDLAELDLAAGRQVRARQRFTQARARLVEAGASDEAPELLAEIDRRLAALGFEE